MKAALGGKRGSTRAEGALRLFFALVPDAPARHSLAELAGVIARETGGHATRAENLHLTLAFLGRVPHARVAEVETIGAQAAAQVAPFPLVLDRIGAFPAAGVAWIGTAAAVPGLQQLAAALRDALHGGGFALESRGFHPHVTLARQVRRTPAAAPTPMHWRVEALVLMASDTRPSGALYRAIATSPLRAPAPEAAWC